MPPDVHENGFQHLNLDLSSISPRYQYHLGGKPWGPGVETYLSHFVSWAASENDSPVKEGRFHYALDREYWNDIGRAADADRALLQQLAHAQLLDDLAAFEAGELLPYWFAEALDSPDPDPKFLARP